MPSFRSQSSSLEGKTYHEGWENVTASLITKNILEQLELGEFSAHNDSRRRQICGWFGIKAPHLHQAENWIFSSFVGKRLNHRIKHIWTPTAHVQQRTYLHIALSKEGLDSMLKLLRSRLAVICMWAMLRPFHQATQITLSIMMCNYQFHCEQVSICMFVCVLLFQNRKIYRLNKYS